MPAPKLLVPRQPDDKLISYDSATAELIALSYAKPGRKTLYWLLAFFITAIGFMCFMQLDRIVKAQGRLMPSEGAFTVQPLNPQMIRKILVKVGQVVKKDQVLATCDPTYAAADLTALDEKVKALDAEVRRTQAEQAGVQYVPTANPYDATQKTLFDRRRTDFASASRISTRNSRSMRPRSGSSPRTSRISGISSKSRKSWSV